MRTLSLRVIAGLFLLAATLPAQGRDIPNRQQAKPQPKNGSRLDLPANGQEQEPAAPALVAEGPAPSVSDFWGEPQNRSEQIFLEYEQLGGTRKLTKADAADTLLALQGLGLRTRTTALKALNAPHVPSVELAARLLEAVGEMESDDARLLVETASGVGDVAAAGACLDAAVVLNGGILPARAVALIGHPRRQMRTLAEGRLKAHHEQDYLPGLLKSLRFGRDPDIRLRGARLLTPYLENAEVRDALRASLADSSVLVAFAAAEALAGTRTTELAYLRTQLLQTSDETQRGYLAYARLLQQESLGDLLVDAELAQEMRLNLGSDNLFLSGAAAALLGEYVFRSDIDENLSEFEKAVPFALVRAVAGTEFYPQFSRFAPMAERCLSRIAGLDPGQRERRAWLDWFAASRATFHFVRGNLDLAPEDLPRLQVMWSQAGQPARALTGPQVTSSPVGARLLGPQALAQLVAELDQTPVLDLEVLPGTYGLAEGPLTASIEVRVGPRRKPVRFRGNAGAAWLPQVLASLNAHYAQQSWQDLAGDNAQFIRQHLDDWDQAQPGARAALMARLSDGRVADLDPAVLSAWCQTLVAEQGLAEHWTAKLRDQFLARIPTLVEQPEIATQVLGTALLAADPADAEVFLDQVSGLEEPLASDLMLYGLRHLGPDASRTALADARVGVKVAALRALADAGTAATPLLLQVLEEGEPLLVRVALGSLGIIGDADALHAVLPWASPGAPREIRKEALLTLGALGDDQVLPAILDASTSEDFGTRLAAIGALRKLPGAAADQAFEEILPQYLGTRLESSYAYALQRRGADLARSIYRAHFDHSEAGTARRALVLSSRLGDPAAASRLIEHLASQPNDSELLDGLAFTTCLDFRSMPDPAGVYAVWWRDHSREDPSLWLVDGLRGLGFALEKDFVEGSGATLDVIVADLLEVLEDGPGHLRPRAGLYLTQFTGIDLAALAPSLPPAVVLDLATPWREWLAARTAAGKGASDSK